MKQLQESGSIIICPLQALDPEGWHVGTWVFCRTAQGELELLLLLLLLGAVVVVVVPFFSNISGCVLLAVVPIRAGGALRAAHGCHWGSMPMEFNVLKRFINSDLKFLTANAGSCITSAQKWWHSRRLSDGWGVLQRFNPLSWWLQTLWQQTEEQKTVCISISWEGALWLAALGSVD